MPSLDFEQEKIRFREFYNDNHSLLHTAENTYRNLVEAITRGDSSLCVQAITSRVKDREESISKFSRKYQSNLETSKTPYEIKDYITDLIGVRVVCLYEDNIQLIRDKLGPEFDIINETDKSSKIESTEDSFGYKGLHIDIRIKANRKDLCEYSVCNDFQCEVQIRTIIQDAWSVLDHKIKYKKSIPLFLKRRINALSALFEIADREFLSIRDATQKLEESAKSLQPALVQDQNEIDVFKFLSIANKHFPSIDLKSRAVDGFVQEINQRFGCISDNDLDIALSNNLLQVENYSHHLQQTSGDSMNPFTKIRHCLYLHDKNKFETILFDRQRANFNNWLASQ